MDLNESDSPDFCEKSGIYGEPQILPRVGNQYQVEIPSLISLSDYLNLSKDPNDSETTNAMSIQLVWIRDESETENGSLDFGRNGQRPKVHPLGIGHRLVPGCSENSWSEAEESGLLLGLYVFGKNLVSVKKLISTKQMGDILSYYYGRFYRTGRYKRWSECRKTKTRRCVFGQKIFTGSRHQEFLSRLLKNESEDNRSSVIEMSKAFGEGKIQLEEYIFGLNAKLGINALVEAVGIGKGKRDLTGIITETAKTNHNRPEIPAGKACSLLTEDEIITFLTGGFRLSKAKSNDIFWEAVWPRLLARGWQSEQPGGNFPKNSLLFLVPGIKNISSQNKLVKGDHYYDSVSDILSLVASNPSLLEIDGFTSHEEEPDISEQVEDLPSERVCYLKPRNSDAMKFTVVDTSRASGKARKVRELRTLPFQMVEALTFLDPSSEDDRDDTDFENYGVKYTNGVSKQGVLDFENYDALKLGVQVNGTQEKKSRKSKPIEKDSSAPAAKRRKRSSVPNGEDSRPIFIDINVPLSETAEVEEVSEANGAERESGNSEQESGVGRPRQSTRNRPLTTKVLEAFACGFMDPKLKRKRKDENALKPRASSRRKLNPVTSPPPESFVPVSAVNFPVESTVKNTDLDVFNKPGVGSQTDQ